MNSANASHSTVRTGSAGALADSLMASTIVSVASRTMKGEISPRPATTVEMMTMAR